MFVPRLISGAVLACMAGFVGCHGCSPAGIPAAKTKHTILLSGTNHLNTDHMPKVGVGDTIEWQMVDWKSPFTILFQNGISPCANQSYGSSGQPQRATCVVTNTGPQFWYEVDVKDATAIVSKGNQAIEKIVSCTGCVIY